MKVLVLSSHTPSLFWFRTELMLAMKAAGYDVIAVAQMSEAEWKNKFQSLGIKYRQIRVSRNGLNPIDDIKTICDIKKLLKEEHPDKIFTYQAKTISYGCCVAAALGITEVYAMVAGLGSIFRGVGFKNKLVRLVMSVLYKKAFSCSKNVFIQNIDDRKLLVDAHLLNEEQIIMINGSGVNLDKFTIAPLPEKITFLYIGRLIRDKGIGEYLSACKQIKEEYGSAVRCLLVGPFDSNPSALTENELKPLIDAGIIEYFGEQSDVRPFIEQASVFVLPSYHEGTPKTVLENMAMGRPIITTDAPGCRETVVNGRNGYLVPVRSTQAIVEMMQRFITHPQDINRMGSEGRKIAEERFDVKKVNEVILRTMGMIGSDI